LQDEFHSSYRLDGFNTPCVAAEQMTARQIARRHKKPELWDQA